MPGVGVGIEVAPPYSNAPMSGALPFHGRLMPALFAHVQARSRVMLVMDIDEITA